MPIAALTSFRMKNIIDLILRSVPFLPPFPIAGFSGLFRTALHLDRAIPDPAPETGTEGTVIGLLFDEGPLVVEHTVRVLEEDRDLFAAYPDPGPLQEHQVRASGWLRIHEILQELADRAAVLHRLEQAAATRQALEILRAARAAARSRYATREDRERAWLLGLPETVLRSWQRRKGGR